MHPLPFLPSVLATGLISGHYASAGVASHDGATGKMGKVDVEIRLTARS